MPELQQTEYEGKIDGAIDVKEMVGHDVAVLAHGSFHNVPYCFEVQLCGKRLQLFLVDPDVSCHPHGMETR